ncbi:hypothetical protein, partial [Pseudomonas jessenii]|uniref:hypothetical protein n=1 Tax=Pseudomonas jessenii TaxID=77298 RepID=UPI0019D45325
ATAAIEANSCGHGDCQISARFSCSYTKPATAHRYNLLSRVQHFRGKTRLAVDPSVLRSSGRNDANAREPANPLAPPAPKHQKG